MISQALTRAALPLRRVYYATGKRPPGLTLLPRRAQSLLGLDDPTAVGSRRVEIGGGAYSLKGFIHVDIWPYSPHVEYVAPAWDLPFPEDWAEELVAIHSLEHVSPARLIDTLTEWRRVLRPGAPLHISVPNGPVIMDAYGRASLHEKWPLMGSLLGMYCGPDLRDPRRLTHRADHQIIFDSELLLWAVKEAGFEQVEDRTGVESDRHTQAWAPIAAPYSLIVRAKAPANSRVPPEHGANRTTA
ncbi:MAG: hypothetical protein M3296_01920 [Actinomycetota bacterium]|nr:hypothetical protein [Actinomycetota bacterium]